MPHRSISLFRISVDLRIKWAAWNERLVNRDLDLVEESIRIQAIWSRHIVHIFSASLKKHFFLAAYTLFSAIDEPSLSEFLLCDSVILSVNTACLCEFYHVIVWKKWLKSIIKLKTQHICEHFKWKNSSERNSTINWFYFCLNS